jgi:hypothetical protein
VEEKNMRTPWGFECQYFFGDYYRGRKREECRLVNANPSSSAWSPDLCKYCPVPAILLANACPNMVLRAAVNKGILGLGRSIKISAYCTLVEKNVEHPEIGCGKCHPLPEVFIEDSK